MFFYEITLRPADIGEVLPMRRNLFWRQTFSTVLLVLLLLNCVQPSFGQQKPALRPLRIALPSNTIAATHFYVGRTRV